MPRSFVACDFFVVVTATFRNLYVFVLMEVGSRRILHHNVTAHPTAEWTLQQFREALPGDHAYRFVIHDRETIFSQRLDQEVTGLGVRVLRTPVRAPRANAVCERLGGSLRRECLDFLIPINERHLKMTVTEWVIHYNRGRVVRKKRSVATQPPSRAYIHDASRRVWISSQPGTPQADCVGARWREPATSWAHPDRGLTPHAAFRGYSESHLQRTIRDWAYAVMSK